MHDRFILNLVLWDVIPIKWSIFMSFKFGLALAAVATLAVAPMASAQTNNNGQLLGGAVGAVLGGVAGSQLARSGDRTEGSVIGAVVGGLAGAAIGGNNNRNNFGGNGSYYNGGYNGGYYNSGGGNYTSYPTYTRTTTYTQPYYSQPVYSRPYYGGGFNSGSRTSLNINLGSGFLGGSRGFGNRGFIGGNSVFIGSGFNSGSRFRNRRRGNFRRF